MSGDTGRGSQPTTSELTRQHRETDAEIQVTSGEDIFQGLLQSAPDAIVIVNVAGRIAIVNTQAERLFGYTRDELIGQPLEILLPEQRRAGHLQHRNGFVADPRTRPMGSGLDLIACRKDGSQFPVEISLSPLQTEQGLLVTSAIRDITDRKRARQELERQAVLLREQAQLLDLVHDTIIVRDMHRRITFWNRGAEAMYGWSKTEALGNDPDIFLQTQYPDTPVEIDAILLGEERWEGELIHTKRDGARIVVASRQVLQRNKQGQPIAMLELNTDITAHTLAEDAVRASQQRLAGIVDIAEDAIISVDAKQRIQMFNQGAERIFGYVASEVMGQPLEMLLPPRFHGIHHRHIALFASTPETARRMGERREIYALHKDGHEFPAEASISKLQLGDEQVFTVILRDITERKQAAVRLEQQVQQRTAHLNTLLAFSRELLGARGLDDVLQRALTHALALVTGAQRGVIRLLDPQSGQLALRASAGWPMMPPLTVATDEGIGGLAFTSRRLQVAGSAAELGALMPEPAREDTLDQSRSRHLLELVTGAVAIPLVVHEQVIGVMVLLREAGTGPFAMDARPALEGLANLVATAILEEQNQQQASTLSHQLAQLEEQQRTMAERLNYAEAGMLQAARLAAVGQLAASIAHEINNPLYAARNALFLHEEDLPAELRASPYLVMTSEQLTRIAGIIERMRDFYRPTRGTLGRVDLNQLLEETLALAGLNLRQGAIRMIFTPAELPPMLGNIDQLRQVFLNLVLNAIDAMPESGTLTVRTSAGPTVALVEVEDTGIGIPEDVRSHLFEPFWTNKANGTGLGLSISAHIVTQHGGQIEVESTVGKGTIFRVVLPFQSGM